MVSEQIVSAMFEFQQGQIPLQIKQSKYMVFIYIIQNLQCITVVQF